MNIKAYSLTEEQIKFIDILAKSRKVSASSAVRFLLDQVMMRKNVEILNQDISEELKQSLMNGKK